MTTGLISIRHASQGDAADIARVHELAWRHSYQGLIPHLQLEQMMARRGPGWWQDALCKGMHALLLEFDGDVSGYVTFGRSRMRGTPYAGEIFELYIRPAEQGVGFGGRLFNAARTELSAHNLAGLCVWSLACNDRACVFYQRLGGRQISEGREIFGDQSLRKVAFAWR